VSRTRKGALSTLVFIAVLVTAFSAPAQENLSRTEARAAAQSNLLWAQRSRIVSPSSRRSGYQAPVAVSGETAVISGLFGADWSLAYV